MRIEDYAVIGDTQTVALVSRDGSIDWLCLPRFDSGACFAALLGTADHGRWRIAPVDSAATGRRRYRGETLVLETTFETSTGTARVIDCMPPPERDPDVVRVVEGVRPGDHGRGADGAVRLRPVGAAWNVRDRHMADTLDRLLDHQAPAPGRMGAQDPCRRRTRHRHGCRRDGQRRQLARERHGDENVVHVGFGGHHGSVIAGACWGAPMQRMPVPPAQPGTHEDLLHQVAGQAALLVFGDQHDTPWLGARRGHRAIGVVYDPAAERGRELGSDDHGPPLRRLLLLRHHRGACTLSTSRRPAMANARPWAT